ncbi:receptor-type tyrosine-protein phosphatase V-like isoform X1 [Megalops cyprinoides]|uniref:receptor-type tyrosine-protein phosphatase V-like isoform X1 n=1 Tax=Megalops cyprinoides TaxID=118141 RepID=UPI0018642E4B|nr:receptor-type tyrosine-protein phosphatase V-like isoform X1 [Megalops cyprinoides]XP_036389243.1 receptor-type tyrosine-protein phosphatase V-like isoform X1 [Megalops cyprinoides]
MRKLTSSQDMRSTSSRARALQELQLRCKALSNNDNAGYRQEFKGLDNVGQEFTSRAGDLDVNKRKNRYPFILPYDHCRVRLALLSSQLHSDYINASYVPGGFSKRDFICTQGPLQNTVADFWRMVWEQNVRVIVMVTVCIENGRVLCEPYWPQERITVSYGGVQVTTLYQRRGPDSLITTMHLRQMGSPGERRITHYYYPAWPDRGVPHNIAAFSAFTELLRQHLDSIPHIGPAIVHCSAGVGRSGTLVALLWLMQLCVRGVQPNVRAVVRDLRKHRVMMVQNLEQYIFVHNCLMHWLSEETTGHKPRDVDSRGPIPPNKVKEPRRPNTDERPTTAQRGRGDHESQRQHSKHRPTTEPSGMSKLHPGNLLRKLLLISSPSQT